MIEYCIGDASNPEIREDDEIIVIAHVCNNIGKWGAGFTSSLDKVSSLPREVYMTLSKNKALVLGKIHIVRITETSFVPTVEKEVANMVAQRGVRSKTNLKPLDIKALEKCLEYLGKSYLSLSRRFNIRIVMPRIGCGLAGGTWEEIEPIIQYRLCADRIKVTVYDLPEQEGKI